MNTSTSSLNCLIELWANGDKTIQLLDARLNNLKLPHSDQSKVSLTNVNLYVYVFAGFKTCGETNEGMLSLKQNVINIIQGNTCIELFKFYTDTLATAFAYMCVYPFVNTLSLSLLYILYTSLNCY